MRKIKSLFKPPGRSNKAPWTSHLSNMWPKHVSLAVFYTLIEKLSDFEILFIPTKKATDDAFALSNMKSDLKKRM